MRLCGETITVMSAGVDPGTRETVYAPTVIAGASWYAAQAEAVDPRGGLVSARRVVTRIPAEAMPEGLVVKGGDIVVKGEAEGDGWTLAALAEAFAERMTVLSVTDNRRAPNGAHVRIVGV